MSREDQDTLNKLVDRIERSAKIFNGLWKVFFGLVTLTASAVLWGARLEWKIGSLENSSSSHSRKLEYHDSQINNLHEASEVLKAKLGIAKNTSKEHSNTN